MITDVDAGSVELDDTVDEGQLEPVTSPVALAADRTAVRRFEQELATVQDRVTKFHFPLHIAFGELVS